MQFENLVKYGGKKTTEKELQEQPSSVPNVEQESDFYEEDAEEGSEPQDLQPQADGFASQSAEGDMSDGWEEVPDEAPQPADEMDVEMDAINQEDEDYAQRVKQSTEEDALKARAVKEQKRVWDQLFCQ